MGRRRKARHIKFYKYYWEWIHTYKQGYVTPITFDKYLLVYKWIRENFDDLDLGDMDRMDVQRMINKYGETHSRPTVFDFFRHIEASLKDANYEGWVDRDPTYKIVITSQFDKQPTREKYLNSEDALRIDQRFLEDAKGGDYEYMGAFCDFMLRTGLRFAEGLGITKQDIEILPSGVALLRVNKTWNYKPKYGEKFMPTKYLERICDELDIPRITVHGLRHTHASLLIANGVSIQSVAKRLGHANTITTQKTYIHLLDTLAQKDELKLMGIMNNMTKYHDNHTDTKHLIDGEVKLLGDAS